MSKGRVSFVAMSARKRNLRGCVAVLHGAWSPSRCVRMSWKNVRAKHLGSERFHLLKNCPRGVSAELLPHKATAMQDFCGHLRDVIQVVAFISPSLLWFVSFWCWLLCVPVSDSRVKVKPSQLYSLASLTHYLFSSSITKDTIYLRLMSKVS